MLQASSLENFPVDLLVTVFSALTHPKDLLACDCAGKAWRTGRATARLPKLALHCDDLDWLLKLNPVQLAAVREVRMGFNEYPEIASASVMLLASFSGRLSSLQRLELHWNGPRKSGRFGQVRYTSDV